MRACSVGLLGGILALSTSVTCRAQVWSPRQQFGGEMAMGAQTVFGSWPLARFQFIDGNLRNQTLVISDVAMRPNRSHPYAVLPRAEGRSWSGVTLDVGAADMQSLSQTYSLNYLSPPTRCFSGAMSWPSVRTLPADRRQSFPVQVPFQVPYTHSGAADLLLDFRMQGGVLANQNVFFGNTYRTEGYRISTEEIATQRSWSAPGTRGCVDSDAAPPFAPAEAGLLLRRSALTHWHAPVRGKVLLRGSAKNLGRSAPFVGVLDLMRRTQGIPFGAPCQQMFLGLSPVAVLFAGVADASGLVRQHNMRIPNGGLFPFVPSLSQQELVVQFAWRDTRSGDLKLSTAVSAEMPEFIASELDARRVCVWGRSLGPWGVADITPNVNPVFRYN